MLYTFITIHSRNREKWGDLGGTITDCEGNKKEKAGMVWLKEEVKQKTSAEQLPKWRRRERAQEEDLVQMERHSQKGPESLEHRGGLDHW